MKPSTAITVPVLDSCFAPHCMDFSKGCMSFPDAILLEALVVADPENESISKLVKNLLSKRRNGIWKNTQENCWALIALDRYFSGK